MDEAKTARLGVAGLGGYAYQMAELVLRSGAGVDPPAALVAVCDPQPGAHSARIAELRERGVGFYDDYDAMLAGAGLDGVWLPVPIALHVPFAERALAAGVAVMVEKPVAGTVDDVDRLIAARDAAGLPVLVGFQDIYAPSTLPMKRRLLAGELGPLSAATLRFCSPRPDSYFRRNDWAGSLRRHGTWTLDSPVNNAMAHFVNLALFLLGPTEDRSATVTGIEAELYRAADIENYDTASLRVHLDAGPSLLVLMSHATATPDGPLMRFTGGGGTLERDFRHFNVHRAGNAETLRGDDDFRPRMLEAFTRAIRGREPTHRRRHARGRPSPHGRGQRRVAGGPGPPDPRGVHRGGAGGTRSRPRCAGAARGVPPRRRPRPHAPRVGPPRLHPARRAARLVRLSSLRRAAPRHRPGPRPTVTSVTTPAPSPAPPRLPVTGCLTFPSLRPATPRPRRLVASPRLRSPSPF